MSEVLVYLQKEPLRKGDFIVEYNGKLLTATDGYKSEEEYAKHSNVRIFLYFFLKILVDKSGFCIFLCN